MPTLLQINTVINSGSTGHIAEELGNLVMQSGWKSYIAYGRNPRPSSSESIRIGSKWSVYSHVLITRLFDRHGFGSYFATKKLIKQIKKIKPDIIHLHNIHGYYLNIKVFFEYLKTLYIPVVWTLHDCWAFTGHCSHYTAGCCSKWQAECFECPQEKQYPKSFFDNSRKNYNDKKRLFSGIKNLTLITPSEWLAEEVGKSFLGSYAVKVIHNGIDLNVFKPSLSLKKEEPVILGVASTWTDRKGFYDFIKLSKLLKTGEQIVLIGVNEKQKAMLPQNIVGISRTENQQQLAEWYRRVVCFLNLTYEDNFPTTNIESLACGTPVITYRAGGSPEIIDENTGFVTEAGDIAAVRECITKIENAGKELYLALCRSRAVDFFDKECNFKKYIKLYNDLTL
ncbi:glycosyltransferase [Treponema brennaborense]|uniref:Glycosyl transferase group 1 n=1 Tax=Treponema brennaborense (strain DSM 12168 / CIP 105900 / DD5/3) TaxID=906968 RepID=F4LL67_TREBD|nr:glycosyltransferase [Treponema brennaborense]AEE17641.1 glycosyl transferase group 1 [Treponema brennaborense DSM 12168]